MAFHLPGLHYLDNEDGCDDGEYGAMRYLLHALKSVDITHRVILVTRHYDGVHIGVERFSSYLLAGRSTILQSPENTTLENKIQRPWSAEYCTFHYEEPDASNEQWANPPYNSRHRGN